MNINELKKEIQSLTAEERNQLISDLNIEHYDRGDYVTKVQDEKENKTPISCPHCNSSEVISREFIKE